MRSILTANGTLPEPKSLAWAITRLAELRREVGRIDLQLINPARVVKLGADGYDAWNKRARGAQRVLKKELQLLEAWVSKQVTSLDVVKLLMDARGLFRALAEDDVLEPDEVAVLERLDLFLDETHNRQKKETAT